MVTSNWLHELNPVFCVFKIKKECVNEMTLKKKSCLQRDLFIYFLISRLSYSPVEGTDFGFIGPIVKIKQWVSHYPGCLV